MKNSKLVILITSVTLLVSCQTSSPTANTLTISEDTENSVVLDNGERVCDLAGSWDAIYKQVDGINEDVVEITQAGSEFSGIKTIGSVFVPKGSETIKGTLDASGISSMLVKSANGWKNVISTQIEDCNAFIVKLSRSKISFTRQ